MRLEEFKEEHIEEILNWADDLDNILTPDSICPEKLKDYPLAMETSERLKKICKFKAKEIREEITQLEDIVMDKIDSEEILFKMSREGIPTYKKKFNTVEKRKRELRRRLADNAEYKRLKEDLFKWDLMFSDWVAHVNRLRREKDILMINYSSAGGEGSGL